MSFKAFAKVFLLFKTSLKFCMPFSEKIDIFQKKGVDKHLQKSKNALKSQKSLDNARIFSYAFNYQIAVQCKKFERKISYELGDS